MTSVLPLSCAAANGSDTENQHQTLQKEVYYSDYSANQKVVASVKPVEITGDKLAAVGAEIINFV